MNRNVGAIALCVSSVVAGVAAGQVTVDGNLSDIAAVAQATLTDPPNDVCTVGKSGFDFTTLYVYYDHFSVTNAVTLVVP
ncbi:MAG: hypothetical protein HYR85_25240 [Planctomycetes bacterium]|nr:hypothetical protein [Planctomycetota bacterium]MBI3843323.1 hypothetical protein [Planctomycetota bacterium]